MPGVGEDAVAMVVCLQVEKTIFHFLGRLWKPHATETLLGALAWFAGIRQQKRQIGTDLDKEFGGGSSKTVLQEFDNRSGE